MRNFVLSLLSALLLNCAHATADASMTPRPAPSKTVVLTFDDAAKSQATFVAPLLKELGFDATFFITAAFMDDTANFMSWHDVAALYRMGFEIGNHSWSHGDFGTVDGGMKLAAELRRVEEALAEVGVAKPVSFAWPGNTFGPEGLKALKNAGYRWARRGMSPEKDYGSTDAGPWLSIEKSDPLLIPTTRDMYPYTTLAQFKSALAVAPEGGLVVLQFHGVPDNGHFWVSTSRETFRACMSYLKENAWHVIAMRDLARYYDLANLPNDPLAKTRVTARDVPFAPAMVDYIRGHRQ